MTPETLTAIGTVLVPLCSLFAAIITGWFAYKAKQTSEQTWEKTDAAKSAWLNVIDTANPERSETVREQIRYIASTQKTQAQQLRLLTGQMDALRKDVSTLIANEMLK